MVVYHLKVSVGSRASGQSASAKSAYIERTGRYAQDIAEREHVAYGHMPAWAENDPHAYWQAADAHERANGRLYREVQFALPRELAATQCRELAGRFAERLTGEERLPYTLAIHRGGPDGENPHVHLMFSERTNDGLARGAAQWFKRYNAVAPEQGGARKSRAAMPQAWLEQIREAWAQAANVALEQAGHRERIDHRSLADLRDDAHRNGDLERAAELSREPNVHLGPQAFTELSMETPSARVQQAERVEQHNHGLVQERDGLDQQIEVKAQEISRIEMEIHRVEVWIREMAERIAERARHSWGRRSSTWRRRSPGGWCARCRVGGPGEPG